ncbi:MAG: NrfD/PsrC family molybdoenzyme membrane anchor subunit, partial [Candidatus Latescibacterota bacterium]
RESSHYFLFASYHAVLFWGGLIFVGSVIPALLLFNRKRSQSVRWIIFAAVLVVIGVICERYLIVLPGQEHPPNLFPGMEVTSKFLQEGFVRYKISLYEIFQALGVFSFIAMMFVLGLKYLPLLPTEAKVYVESQMLKHMFADAD